MNEAPANQRSLRAFGRHLVEMLVVMVIGMTALGFVDGALLRAAGLGWLRDRPLADLALMSLEMSVPMAAWMDRRGHARRHTAEMALAMLVPAAALILVGATGAIGAMDAEMAYHPLMLVAMIGVMAVRPAVYAVDHRAHHAAHPPHPSSEVRPMSAKLPVLRPSLARLAAIAAPAGILVEIVAAGAHPSRIQPNDSAAVFAEYAESSSWVTVHLAQFVGSLLVGVAIVIIALAMRRDRRGAAAFAVVGALAAVLGLAVFAVQMAVDGVALKAAIDSWIGASEPAVRSSAFVVADVVRSLEKGLDGVFGLLNGTSLGAIGIAIVLGRRFSLVLAIPAIVAGAGLAASGWLTALTGFSPEAATFARPAEVALLLFLVGSAAQLAWSSRPSRGGGGAPRRDPATASSMALKVVGA